MTLSRTFARRSSALGEQRGWSVMAAAWDRALIAKGEPQRFGTQFVREDGRWTLGKVDPSVTDAERAMYKTCARCGSSSRTPTSCSGARTRSRAYRKIFASAKA